MENFETIENKINNMENEQISRVKGNPLFSIILLTAGIILIILGAAVMNSNTLISIAVVLGIIISITGFIYLMKNTGKNSGYYIFTPTKQRLINYTIFLDSPEAQKIITYINNNNFSGIKSLKKVANSGKMLEARGTDDGSIFLFQLLEYVPHNFVPSSPVVVLQGNDAKLMLEFVNSEVK